MSRSMRVSACSFRNLEFSSKSSDDERDSGVDGFEEDLTAAIKLANVPSGIPSHFDATGCNSFCSNMSLTASDLNSVV
jgi:hypothetical protein